ncbi:MAG: hypothetical protein MHPSP_000855 [Paramarteilia canceri]
MPNPAFKNYKLTGRCQVCNEFFEKSPRIEKEQIDILKEYFRKKVSEDFTANHELLDSIKKLSEEIKTKCILIDFANFIKKPLVLQNLLTKCKETHTDSQCIIFVKNRLLKEALIFAKFYDCKIFKLPNLANDDDLLTLFGLSLTKMPLILSRDNRYDVFEELRPNIPTRESFAKWSIMARICYTFNKNKELILLPNMIAYNSLHFTENLTHIHIEIKEKNNLQNGRSKWICGKVAKIWNS